MKTTSPKSLKIDIFPKGLTHGFGPKKTPLQAINAFIGYKKKSTRSRKIDIFPKGVNPWFWSKNGHFSNFFLAATQARKMVFMIFQNTKTSFQAIKTSSPKSRKIDSFPKGLTIVLVQKWKFSTLFFLGNIGKDNVYYDILERKNAFLGYKNKKSKKSKN